MIQRVLLTAVMLLGLAGFVVIGVVVIAPWRHAGAEAPPPPPPIGLIAAAGLLRPGVLLKPADMAVRQVPRGEQPEGSVEDTPAARSELVGAMVRRPIAAGAPFLPEDVLRPGDHGFLAAVLRPGKRAATVAVDAVSGSAGLIWPGDAVDVILTQLLELPGLAPGHRVAAETVLRDARVIAIDQLLAGGLPPVGLEKESNRTVTLEVNAADAEKVQVAVRIGRLSLVVRSAEAGGVQDAVNGPTWAADVSPALAGARAPIPANVLRVFTGSSEGKEFRF